MVQFAYVYNYDTIVGNFYVFLALMTHDYNWCIVIANYDAIEMLCDMKFILNISNTARMIS